MFSPVHRGSISGSHEDYPFQAPSVIVVSCGRKLLWVAPGPFRQLISHKRCTKTSAELLYRSMCVVTPEILQRLHDNFSGHLLEVSAGEGAVVPPCRVHAVYNMQPTISINYTVCSQEQWAHSFEATVLIGIQHRKELARKAALEELQGTGASSSVGVAEVSARADALLKLATDTGGRKSFDGCVVMFNRGWTDWVEERIRQDVAAMNLGVGGVQYEKVLKIKERLSRVAKLLLASGGGMDTLLATGADAKWGKRMLQFLGKAGIQYPE